MNLFDLFDKLMGNRTQEDRDRDRDRQRARAIDRYKRENNIQAPKPVAPKPREFTPNDPDYYRLRGSRSEAESQQRANSYREAQRPGIKPLFPQAATVNQVDIQPRTIQPSVRNDLQPLDERFKITNRFLA